MPTPIRPNMPPGAAPRLPTSPIGPAVPAPGTASAPPAAPDTRPVSALRNLGPATEAEFARAGITTVGQLVALGADAAYLRLLETGTRPHFIGYYVLVMALQGRPWNDCKGAEKSALRARFDALKTRATASDAAAMQKGRPDFEAALDALGVVPRQQAADRRTQG